MKRVCKRSLQGFILLITLQLIGIISLLVLSTMQHLLFYHKAINRQALLQQHFYNLEKTVKHLVTGLHALDLLACVVHETSANQILHDLKPQGCSLFLGGFQYHYLIEDMGSFPCLITDIGGFKKATHHYRISVEQLEKDAPAMVMQVRVILAREVMECTAKENRIPLGLSSWRYLTQINGLSF